MNELDIIKANITDVNQLQIIGRKTFFETFKEANTEEDMKQYLKDNFSSQKLDAELTNINSEFYFAQIKGRVVGYLKINFGPSQTEQIAANSLEIERIYVLKEFQGKRVGQLLYNKALEIGSNYNHDFVWLGVWEKNPKAIDFYTKNGFVAFDKHIFKLGNDEQTDILMKLILK